MFIGIPDICDATVDMNSLNCFIFINMLIQKFLGTHHICGRMNSKVEAYIFNIPIYTGCHYDSKAIDVVINNFFLS